MRNLICFMLFCILILYSCEKSTLSDINPTIQLKISDSTVFSDTSLAAGNQYKLGIMASSVNGENLTNLIVESNGIRIVDLGFNMPELDTELVLTKTNEETELINIIIFNKARKSDTVSLIIKKLVAAYSPITRYSDLNMGAQSNMNTGNYFSLSNGQIYTQAEAYNNQQLIDLIYYFDPAADANTLASPGANLTGIIIGSDAPDYWTIRRTTKYSRTTFNINEQEFISATNDSLIVANLFSDGGRKAKQLKNNQYYEIQTNEGKFGIIQIQTVSGLADGNILFSLIVQK